MELLNIKDLHVNAGNKEILKGLNLTINEGETHVIMGPNGAGKSTLANIILNNPEYKIIDGEIDFEGENINDLKTDERARKGIFMSFQTPEEVPGISVMNFIKAAKSAQEKEMIKVFAFKKELEENMQKLDMKTGYSTRDLNVGFSGGEKKNEDFFPQKNLSRYGRQGLDIIRGVRVFRLSLYFSALAYAVQRDAYHHADSASGRTSRLDSFPLLFLQHRRPAQSGVRHLGRGGQQLRHRRFQHIVMRLFFRADCVCYPCI